MINVKHATWSRLANQSSRQVWDRVALAAGSGRPLSSVSGPSTQVKRSAVNFPALPTSTTTRLPSQHRTPWTSGSPVVMTPSVTPPPQETPSSRPGTHKMPAQSNQNSPCSLSSASFPELPSSGSSRPKLVVTGHSLKKTLRDVEPPPSVWTGSANEININSTHAPRVQEDTGGEMGVGKGRKGKGKQKQTLFTLGSFPTT